MNILDIIPSNKRFEVISGQEPVDKYYELALRVAYEAGFKILSSFNLFTLNMNGGSKTIAGAFQPPAIEFPEGNFLWEGTINIPPKIQIRGAGKNRTNFFSRFKLGSGLKASVVKHPLTQTPQYVQVLFEGSVNYRGYIIHPVSQAFEDITLAPVDTAEGPSKWLPICIEDQTTELSISRNNILNLGEGKCDTLIMPNYWDFQASEWEDRYYNNIYEVLAPKTSSNWQVDSRIQDNIFEGGEVVQTIFSGHNLIMQANQQYYTSCPYMLSNVRHSCIIGNSMHPFLDNGAGAIGHGAKYQLGGFVWGGDNTFCNEYQGLSHPVMIADNNKDGVNNVIGEHATSAGFINLFKTRNLPWPKFIEAWGQQFRTYIG